ncbi:polyprenyl synthetase family protein [Phycicoccus endophyticus]|uniref:Polyprenyl synthetase family protein n=1 Tax=Phycicoccus endophyticus TaxID=1690220 RepID=A0A7G9R605_9MICO|nr:polyprenyl synthetase family protein [Phycicoccus endophyticus]QNN51030.1 polyprenyl synthetase family protein [Phycicoccus endophyticus]GGL32779.1 geranylgeranyl pyrophosphate synthase [Phycicoccus endophyticus]
MPAQQGTPSVLALPGASDGLRERLVEGLRRVEDLIAERVDHEDPFIAGASSHLTLAGGKRFRPLLTLLAAELGAGASEEVVAAAAGVELTHLASLYHDDVMDEADVRRGAPSANARYDNSTAILVGDLLFGTASDIVADLGPEAVKIQAQTFVRLCAGQIRDERPCPEGEDPVEYYLRVLEDKTGVLIATAARYGAMFAGCPAPVVETMREYGERLGMAFQLADDLIDIASQADETGKTPGTDLREGKRTLPVLHVLASSDPADGRLRSLLLGDLSDDDRLEETLTLLRAHPAMERAREQALEVAARAQEVLSTLPAGEAREALHALASGVVTRVG